MARNLKRTLVVVGVVWVAALIVGGLRFAQWKQGREYEKGIEFFESGRLAEAEEHLRTAKMWGPRAWDIREQLGSVLMRQGRYQEALAEFKDAARLAPGQSSLHLQQGFCLVHLKRYGDAREAFLKAAEVEPENTTGLWLAASMSEKMGEIKTAEGYLRKLLSLSPDDARAAERLAKLGGQSAQDIENP